MLDPAQRYFPRDVLADDRLAVGDTVLAPEAPRSWLSRAGWRAPAGWTQPSFGGTVSAWS